jgi:hypothetical protein
MYRPVRMVVWQGPAGDCRSHADQKLIAENIRSLSHNKGVEKTAEIGREKGGKNQVKGSRKKLP